MNVKEVLNALESGPSQARGSEDERRCLQPAWLSIFFAVPKTCRFYVRVVYSSFVPEAERTRERQQAALSGRLSRGRRRELII